MASLVIIIGSLVTITSSQCYWDVFDPDDGSRISLNLTSLRGVTLNMTDTESYPNLYYYTICQNDLTCQGQSVMAKYSRTDYPSTCYTLGRWENYTTPYYQNINGGTWTFRYYNGDNDCGNPARTWAPTFVCDPDVEYKVGYVTDVAYSCYYQVEIHTKYACAGWTTTTTAPDAECIFKSENDNHTLNMTSIRGKTLMEADETGYLYYMYTPCANSAKCNDNDMSKVMAYVYDGMNFECKQYLAIWDGGYAKPNYIEGVGMWQFTYTNGQTCNARESVFNVVWFCDKTATSPRVIQAKEIGMCVYQMVINSTLACE